MNWGPLVTHGAERGYNGGPGGPGGHGYVCDDGSAGQAGKISLRKVEFITKCLSFFIHKTVTMHFKAECFLIR